MQSLVIPYLVHPLSQALARGIFPLLTVVRLLDLVKAFLPVLPEIEYPVENISIDEKVIFSIGSGILFMLAQIPIYGLVKDAPLKMADPFAALRPMFAMEQGSLLELGLLPVVSAAFLWQVAAGFRLVKVNFSYTADRELYQTAQKLTAFVFSAVFAVSLILSGYYDQVIRGSSTESSPYGSYALIFVQIFGWNVLLTLLVEVIDKGYGFGSGVLCFLALNAATGLVRDVVGLELVSATPDGEPQTYGVIAYLIKSLFSMEFGQIKEALVGIFTRSGFPSIGMVLLAVATGLVTIILQNVRLEIPVRSSRARGTANIYPIRMLYTGGLPVLFAFTAVANVQVVLHFVSLAVAPFYATVGSWLETRTEAGAVSGGLAFYFSAPASLTSSLLSPIRAVVYTATLVGLSTFYAQKWSVISGSGPKDIAQQFKDQSIIMAGKRDASVAKELSRTIPVAAVTGAAALVGVSVLGELAGAAGKTVSVVVGVSSAFAILEDFMMAMQESGGNLQFASSLGY